MQLQGFYSPLGAALSFKACQMPKDLEHDGQKCNSVYIVLQPFYGWKNGLADCERDACAGAAADAGGEAPMVPVQVPPLRCP